MLDEEIGFTYVRSIFFVFYWKKTKQNFLKQVGGGSNFFWSHNMGNFWWTKCDKKGRPKYVLLCIFWYARESIQNCGSHSFLQHKLSRDFMVAGVQRLISDPGFYCNTM
jgi:hypothetical protein